LQISILHLSDFHFKETNNSFFQKVDKLILSISNKLHTSKYLFIVITGDLAYSGKRSEYEEVEKALKSIENSIEKKVEGLKIKFIFSPGNHDCDFSGENTIRNILIDNINKNPSICNEEIVNELTAVQSEYFNFIKKYESYSNINKKISNNLITKYEYTIDIDYKISFNCYNTSWMSSLNENQSKLIFPLNCIEKENISFEENNLTISIFHHPYHWLESNNIRQFKELLTDSSDYILTGHEHTPSAKKETDIFNKKNVINLEAGTLQDSYNKDESKFNLIQIDTKEEKNNLIVFKWTGNDYDEIENKHIKKSCNIGTKFTFNREHYDKINALGIRVNHHSKENLVLNDLFIYPDLKVIKSYNETKLSFKRINSESIIKKDILGLNIIYGADNSGKTKLGHVYQSQFRNLGFIPILISSSLFKSNINPKKINKIVNKAFKKQYTADDNMLKHFERFNNTDKILIIEDFHRVNGNNEFKANIIDILLKSSYKNIIIFSNDSLKIEATTETTLSEKLETFTHYEIETFGAQLREKLVRKWIILGQKHNITEKELQKIKRDKAKRITHTIGWNIVPSYPLYLLTLLQAMQINDKSIDNKSSYGYYYHFLINQYLTNSNIELETQDFNTIYRYCSELSYNMFITMNHEYTYEELDKFDAEYKTNKDFFPHFNILNLLIDSKILIKDDEKFKISHKYIYYYFVAYFFSKNIDDSKITSIIEKMTKRLYRTEFSNILMFILHLSPEKEIINMLKKEAEKMFEEFEEFKYSNDELTVINNCIKKDTHHRLEKRTIEESRQLEITKEEKENERKAIIYYDDTKEAHYDEEIQNLDFFKRLNLAFKIIEILGEIIKNYSGSLDGPIKEDLIRLVYKVGLRSIKTFINVFEEQHEQIVIEIERIIRKKNLVTEDKIIEAIYSSIFAIASNISTDIIKKISKAVGSKDLLHIFDRINDKTDNISYEILKHGVSLEFSGYLKDDKIIKMHENFKKSKNLLADSTLKSLVLDHIYMFETSHAKKASLCKKLDISSEVDKERQLKQLQ